MTKTAHEAHPEIVNWHRSPTFPGVEVINATDSPREWRIITPTYYVVAFDTWRGRIRTLGRELEAKPGAALCMTPNEPMVATPFGGAPGSFNVMEIHGPVLEEWLAEHGHSGRLAWTALMQAPSPSLRASFVRFCRSFAEPSSALEAQSRAAAVSRVLLEELIAHRGTPALGAPQLRNAERMRAHLHENPDVDLDTLARAAGLSRFQALRAFKRRYALPPHAYQLCLRVTRARLLLLEGMSPVAVAAECGFADQSHFTRHFKRCYGVTPRQYVRPDQLIAARSETLLRRTRALDALVSSRDH